MFFGFLFDTLYSRNHFPGKVGDILGTIFKFFFRNFSCIGFCREKNFCNRFQYRVDEIKMNSLFYVQLL